MSHAAGEALDEVLLRITLQINEAHAEAANPHYQMAIQLRMLHGRPQLLWIGAIDLQLEATAPEICSE